MLADVICVSLRAFHYRDARVDVAALDPPPADARPTRVPHEADASPRRHPATRHDRGRARPGPGRYNARVMRPDRPRPGSRSARLAALALLALLLSCSGTGRARAQDDPRGRRNLERIIADMTVAERVGQLFVVPFRGGLDAGSDLARLLDERQVGGILLVRGNGNFDNGQDAPTRLARLTAAAQARVAKGRSESIPLLIALPQAGGAFPASPLHGGMTPLPSQLAIGATWDASRATAIGEIVGRELAAVGVNLLLGPSLDVNTEPRPASSGDLGVRSFGGSPAWVARMGAAYVSGVHLGGGGRVATAVGSFPGLGGADRSPSQEIAVVERGLDQLLVTDLPPFVALAEGEVDGSAEVTDAMMTSHVRYRSIQRQSDRPFSLDSNGLRYLDGQVEAIGRWRAAGGLRVSAGLGLPTVRRYVDAELDRFSPRRVIRESLLAGNDLLVLEGFDTGPSGVMTGTAEIEEGIAWLAGEYEADEEVRARVDDALLRILAFKQRLYGSLPDAAAGVDPEAAATLTGTGDEAVIQVAREALTLISPADGSSVAAPQPGERILLIVDARESRECADCEVYLDLDPARLLETLRRAYGPEGSGTARLRVNSDVEAVTYRDLKLWLQDTGKLGPEASPVTLQRQPADRPSEAVGELVAGARWLVFAMRDVRPAEAPASDALRLFLAARPRTGTSDAQAQRIVALAFEAPYTLDTTEIAGLHALYAVYARSEPFLEVAVRALFGDVAPRGSSPVSVPGAGYDLARQLLPAQDQVVSLEPVGWATGQDVRLGDTFRVRTSPIQDLNGHLVPDGTRVTFRRYVRSGDVFLQDVPATTLRGRALASVRAEREGEVEITVVQNGQALGEPLLVRIRPGITLDAPTTALPLFGPGRAPVDWGILLLSLSLILLAGVLVYGIDPETVRSPTLLVRLFLLSLAWGLAGYLLVAAGGIRLEKLPGDLSLWPEGWSPAYQAPVLSLGLALLPVLPSMLRAIRARRR